MQMAKVLKLAAKELRLSEPTKEDLEKIKRKPIYIICDNILDTYNIGSIFRLADAVAASCVYLCAGSETPPNSRIAKAAVGTEKWVKWEYFKTAEEAIRSLRKKFSTRSNNKVSILRAKSRSSSIKIVAIEQHPKAKDFRSLNYERLTPIKSGLTMNPLRSRSEASHEQAVAFVVGHETDGVSKEALALCDEIVEIPMFGVNRSLNVMVSLAIVLYTAI